MDDIIRAVAERTVLSEDQARQAAETIVGLLKERLPEPANSMLAQVVGQPGEPAGAGEEAAGETASQPGVIGQANEAVRSIFNR